MSHSYPHYTASTGHSIGVLRVHRNKIYAGSYVYNNISTGTLQLYCEDMILYKTVETSGTFDILIHDNFVYACTACSLIKFSHDLIKLKEYLTNSINTYAVIKDQLLYVCTGQGYLDVYSLDLTLIYRVQISNDILWCCLVYNNTILCGGECSTLFYIENRQIINRQKLQHGITCLFADDDYILMGSYDEHVYVIQNFEVLSKHYIGGGVWRIEKLYNTYYVSCMYEGVKILNAAFQIQKQIQTKCDKINKAENRECLVYAIDVTQNFLVFATFYGKQLYKINLKELEHNLYDTHVILTQN